VTVHSLQQEHVDPATKIHTCAKARQLRCAVN
jgi:hypothetical protein